MENFSPSTSSPMPLQSLSVDNTVLEELRAIMGDRLGAIIAAYLADGANYVAAIADAVQSKDSIKVQKSAHALRSASGQVGALQLADYLGQLEDAAENNDLTIAKKIWNDTQIEYEKVRQALGQISN